MRNLLTLPLCYSIMPYGLRLLLVEPDNDLRYVISTLFQLSGCTVEEATSGTEVLTKIDRFVPDVVVSELVLPDVDGFRLAAKLRTNPSMRDTVLIAFTGFQKEGIEIEALQAGFTHLLLKPVMFERLLDTLRPIAEKRGCNIVWLEN